MAVRSTNFQKLLSALSNATAYPLNNSGIEVQSYTADVLSDQLESRSAKLFCGDNRKAEVRFFELQRTPEGYQYQSCTLQTATGLMGHLRLSASQHRDPCQRFIFIGAQDSRSALRVTREMTLQLLTYHQVSPGFLTFIFPFGKQRHARDFHLSGFRSDTCSRSPRNSLRIGELGRSGQHIELCYNLRSVERQKHVASGSEGVGVTAVCDRLQQWSIRPCSVHHKFDLNTQQMTWIVIKANNVIQRAIQDRLDGSCRETLGVADALDTALTVHRIITGWAGENWHWYINELEGILQDRTRRTISIPLQTASLGLLDSCCQSQSPKRGSERGWPSLSKRSSTFNSVKQAFSWSNTTQDDTIPMTEEPQNFTRRSTFADDSTVVFDDLASRSTTEAETVSFSDLQTIQYLEDEANKTLLVLKANATVLRELGQEYLSVLDTLSDRDDYKRCKDSVERFTHHLKSVENDLELQQSRLETLLRIFSDRKAMLENILQWRNMRTMEEMTRQMHDLARRTQHETVYMRTITLVTLFFLPGTFISTLMSTPIVDFSNTNNNPKDFSWRDDIGVGALKLYLLFSLPMIIVTFIAWGAVYKWVRRREKQAAKAYICLTGEKAC